MPDNRELDMDVNLDNGHGYVTFGGHLSRQSLPHPMTLHCAGVQGTTPVLTLAFPMADRVVRRARPPPLQQRQAQGVNRVQTLFVSNADDGVMRRLYGSSKVVACPVCCQLKGGFCKGAARGDQKSK